MFKMYVFTHKQFTEKFALLEAEVEEQMMKVAITLLENSGEEILIIYFNGEEKRVCIGEFEPLLSYYCELQAIMIQQSQILFLLELSDEYVPLQEIQGISLQDKLAILDVLEYRLNRPKTGSEAGEQVLQTQS